MIFWYVDLDIEWVHLSCGTYNFGEEILFIAGIDRVLLINKNWVRLRLELL